MNCLNCEQLLTGRTQKKFCSKSCAAKYNNVKFPKRKAQNPKCDTCGAYQEPRASRCAPCWKESEQLRISRMTLGDSLNLDCAKSRYNTVRHHARQYAKKYLPSHCQICGYHKAFQVCHIKGIASFPLDTLLVVINSPDNLAILCPNHHWELDHNLLDKPLGR